MKDDEIQRTAVLNVLAHMLQVTIEDLAFGMAVGMLDERACIIRGVPEGFTETDMHNLTCKCCSIADVKIAAHFVRSEECERVCEVVSAMSGVKVCAGWLVARACRFMDGMMSSRKTKKRAQILRIRERRKGVFYNGRRAV